MKRNHYDKMRNKTEHDEMEKKNIKKWKIAMVQ